MNPDKLYFTSDTHFGHKAVIHFCDRKAKDVEEMDEIMIKNWNDVVSEKDHIFHLGDFSFRNSTETTNIIERLNGHKYLIEGNHDRNMTRKNKDLFEWTKPYYEIKSNFGGSKQRIVLCHFAFRHWHQGHLGAWNLHGHSHGNLPPNGKQLDVGVDCNNLKPFSFYDVRKAIDHLDAWQPDHHKARD
jgi:calcineurin-like phosphoesterase family protein